MRRALLCLIAAVFVTTGGAGSAFAQAQPQFQFVLGFKVLHDMIPDIVGQPLENEHFDPRTGDALQATTNGLLVWRKADNLTAFTDGSTTWINGPFGLQSRPNDARFPWEPTTPPEPVPPPATVPPSPIPVPRPPGTNTPSPHPENWSGYSLLGFTTGKSYTSVTATWVVPEAKVPPGMVHGFSSTWIGVGGACQDNQCTTADPTLIQVGTEQDALGSNTQYSAWYEMLPSESVTISSLAIKPGDKVSAGIKLLSGSRGAPQTWQLTMTNQTTGQSWTQSVRYQSSMASANWIVEAPFAGAILPLANLGTTTVDLATANGASPNLDGTQRIIMVNPNGQVANTSAPDSDGDGFNVCTGAATDVAQCPTPAS